MCGEGQDCGPSVRQEPASEHWNIGWPEARVKNRALTVKVLVWYAVGRFGSCPGMLLEYQIGDV